jgi:hypothetical protein
MRKAEEAPGQFSVTVPADATPPGATYMALKRIRYFPGAMLASPPIDGPTLLRIVSGQLTVQTAIDGAATIAPDVPGNDLAPLAPGVPQTVIAGATIFLPAGVPAQFSNLSAAAVDWLQLDIETPPTLCTCGEDRSAVAMEVLASRTLAQPIRTPAFISLRQQRLAAGQQIGPPDPREIQLVAKLDTPGPDLTRAGDGSTRNNASTPVEVIVVTLQSEEFG